MTKIVISFLFLVVVGASVLWAAFHFYTYSEDKLTTRTVIIGSASNAATATTLHVLVADEPREHIKGLSNRLSLEGFDGMLFIFKDTRLHTFWNKDILFDLDIFWIRKNKIVGTDFLPESSNGIVRVLSPEPIDTVLEVPVGKLNQSKLNQDTLIIY